MKKLATVLSAFLLIVGIPAMVFADEISPHSLTSGYLSIGGNTAICTAYMQAETTDTYVSMKLWHNNFCIKSWTEQGEKTILLNKHISLQKGELYKLTIDISIDGVPQPRIEQTKRC